MTSSRIVNDSAFPSEATRTVSGYQRDRRPLMLDHIRRQMVRAALRGWPEVVSSVSGQLYSAMGELDEEERREVVDAYNRFLPKDGSVKVEDASAFVQHMAGLEGQIRLKVCEEGCCCKMVMSVGNGHDIPGGVVLSIQAAHDPWCPWVAKFNERAQEAEEAAA